VRGLSAAASSRTLAALIRWYVAELIWYWRQISGGERDALIAARMAVILSAEVGRCGTICCSPERHSSSDSYGYSDLFRSGGIVRGSIRRAEGTLPEQSVLLFAQVSH
jgi:hypothetical protein